MFAAVTLATVFATASVEATVVDRQSHWQDGLIVTDTTLRIERVLAGEAPAQLSVRQLGGAADGIGQIVFGDDALPAGDVGARVATQLVQDGSSWRVLGKPHRAHKAEDGTDGDEDEDVGGAVRATTDINKSCGSGPPIDLHWRGDHTSYVINGDAPRGMEPSDVQAAVRAAFDVWATVGCSYFHIDYEGEVAEAEVGYRASGNNQNVVTWVERHWEGKSTTQAITVLTFGCVDGVILDADILVNADDFKFTTDPEHDDEEERDLQNVLAHEAGHFVGFAHSPDPSSTMFATVKSDETSKRDLTDQDVAGMCQAYPIERGPEDTGSDVPGCSIGAAGQDRGNRGAAAAVLALLLFSFAALKSRARRPNLQLGGRRAIQRLRTRG